MDITPDSRRLREQLEKIPVVRQRWSIPAQPQWATRVYTILRNTHPNLPHVIDDAARRASDGFLQEIGQLGREKITLTPQEWESATARIAHAAGAAAVVSVAEALEETTLLDQTMSLPDAIGPDN